MDRSPNPVSRGLKPTSGRAPPLGQNLHLARRRSAWIIAQYPSTHGGDKNLYLTRGVETLSFPRVPVLRRLAAALHAPSPRLRVLRRLALHTRSTASSAPSNPGGSRHLQPSVSPSNSSIHSGSPSSIPRFPVSLSLLACVPSSLSSYCTSSLFRFELPLL